MLGPEPKTPRERLPPRRRRGGSDDRSGPRPPSQPRAHQLSGPPRLVPSRRRVRVLLPDTDEQGLSPSDKATGVDAPDAVRSLLASRPGTVLLRWRPERNGLLRRYYIDGSSQDLMIGMSRFGVAKGSLPRYVTIIGGPDQVPEIQHMLAGQHAVGRLPLIGEGLHNHLHALLNGWTDNRPSSAGLVWAVDHGAADLTSHGEDHVDHPAGRGVAAGARGSPSRRRPRDGESAPAGTWRTTIRTGGDDLSWDVGTHG